MKKSKRHQKAKGKQGRLEGQRDGDRRGKDRAIPPGTTRGGVRYASCSPNPNPQPNPPVPPPRPSHTSSPTRLQSKPPKYIPPGTELGKQIRETYTLLKTLHHLSNVDSGPKTKEPKIITQLRETLTKAIKPALLTSKTRELIEENAKTWGVSTLHTLRDHYKAKLAEVIQLMEQRPNPTWEVPFQIATKWAKRNLPRMTKEVLEKARTILASSNQTKTKSNLAERKATEVPEVPSPTPTPHMLDPRLDTPKQPGLRRKTLQLNMEAPQTHITPTKVQTQTDKVQTPKTQQVRPKTTQSKPKISSIPHQLDPEKLQNLFPGEPKLQPVLLKFREHSLLRGLPLYDPNKRRFVIIDKSMDRDKDQDLDISRTGKFVFSKTGLPYNPMHPKPN